jgi:hypothetical protein
MTGKYEVWKHSDRNSSWHCRPWAIYRRGGRYDLYYLDEYAETYQSLEAAQDYVEAEVKRRYEAMQRVWESKGE